MPVIAVVLMPVLSVSLAPSSDCRPSVSSNSICTAALTAMSMPSSWMAIEMPVSEMSSSPSPSIASSLITSRLEVTSVSSKSASLAPALACQIAW